MSKVFLPYAPAQMFLMPPSLREWLPEGHLALMVSELVDALDLKEITEVYEKGDGRGSPPYHPVMMVKLLVYAYCVGKPSSRKIETATHEDVAFRVLAANQHPHHDSIAAFRQRHLTALGGLFLQVLLLCRKAGLVKLGHVAIDGTKFKANASKHKAMSYARMTEAEAKLQQEVIDLLRRAQQVDDEEDVKYGKGKQIDELPAELQRRESRIAKIRQAKAELEAEAKEKAKQQAADAEEKNAKRAEIEAAQGKKLGGRPAQVPDVDNAKPNPKAQRNFTDPQSRIVIDGATKGFIQGYNLQAAVNEDQLIIAARVTPNNTDGDQLLPTTLAIKENLGLLPEKISADAGYFSQAALTDPRLAETDFYVPPQRKKAANPSLFANEMRCKLEQPAGNAIYKMRKAIVEPIFGQIKHVRGFRQFLMRGLYKVNQEWNLIALTHNVLKIWRAGTVHRLLAAAI